MSSLQNFSGTLVLVGAGKMGGAMLEGWLALGLDPKKIAIREPQPSDEIKALAARGVRINPDAISDASVIILAVKPQIAAEVVPPLKALVRPQTVAVSVMAGKTIAFLEGCARREHRDRALDPEHAGRNRPRHHGRGAERPGERRAAPACTYAALQRRRGRVG